MKLAYITNARIPSERANGMQTAQMCAAFAVAGAEVTLYHPRRRNWAEFANVDVWQYYGVPRMFTLRPVSCIDLFHLSGKQLWLERFVFLLQTFTFALSLLAVLIRQPADVYYSRDPFVLALLALGLPHARKRMLFEAHSFPQSRIGRAFRRWALRRVKGTVTISLALEKLYVALGLSPHSVMTAHDGVDISRFGAVPQVEARNALGLPLDGKLVVYTGGLYPGRGLEELIQAIKGLAATLVIVGGKDVAAAQRLKDCAAQNGVSNVLFVGHRPTTDIPVYLAAANVLAMPYSRRTVAPGGITTDWMSPLKMFEYMAAARPIVASDLPVLREVLRDDENALMVKPDDAGSLADGLRRLLANSTLAARLAAQARHDVEAHTWEARAKKILEFAGKN